MFNKFDNKMSNNINHNRSQKLQYQLPSEIRNIIFIFMFKHIVILSWNYTLIKHDKKVSKRI